MTRARYRNFRDQRLGDWKVYEIRDDQSQSSKLVDRAPTKREAKSLADTLNRVAMNGDNE